MMNKYILSILLICCTLSSFAQFEEPQKKKERVIDRMFFGGSFDLAFGDITLINLSPTVGYRITPRFSAGLGGVYIYQKYKRFDFEYSVYGGSVFVEYNIVQNLSDYFSRFPGSITLHLENEVLNVEELETDVYGYAHLTGNRIWIDNVLAGGGLRQPLGRRGAISIMVLWDITEHPSSPHVNPIFRIGFSF